MFGICDICRTSSERLLEFNRAPVCTKCFKNRVRSMADGIGERVVLGAKGLVFRAPVLQEMQEV